MTTLEQYREPPGRYLYHGTSPDNIDSIRTNGLRVDEENSDSNLIIKVLEELDAIGSLPFDRRNVTYFHADLDYVIETRIETDDSGLNIADSAVVIVDLLELDAPIYVANMSIITDLIDYACAGADAMMHADTPEAAIDQYIDSIRPVTSPNDIATYPANGHTHLEVMVVGGVPSESILDARDFSKGSSPTIQ